MTKHHLTFFLSPALLNVVKTTIHRSDGFCRLCSRRVGSHLDLTLVAYITVSVSASVASIKQVLNYYMSTLMYELVRILHWYAKIQVSQNITCARGDTNLVRILSPFQTVDDIL